VPCLEANRFSASQENPRVLWNPEVHYRIQENPPPLSVFSEINPDDAITSYFFKVYLNIVPPFSAPVQTGPGAHPASCTMGTGYFPGVKSGRRVTLTPHPLLVPLVMKE
jgi:hypothetical protein